MRLAPYEGPLLQPQQHRLRFGKRQTTDLHQSKMPRGAAVTLAFTLLILMSEMS